MAISNEVVNQIICFKDYRTILKFLVSSGSETQSQISEVLGIERSFFSKVLAEKADLSSDALYKILMYFNLEKDLFDFVFLIYESNRSGFQKRKEQIAAEVEKLKAKLTSATKQLKGVFKKEKEDFENLYQYYSNPKCLILHMVLVTLSGFAFDQCKIKILNQCEFKEQEFEHCFSILKKLKIVEVQNGKINLLKSVLHLEPESFLNQIMYSGMRDYSKSKMLNNIGKPGLSKHLTATVALSEEDFNWLFSAINNLVSMAQDRTLESAPELVVQFNLDFFKFFSNQ